MNELYKISYSNKLNNRLRHLKSSFTIDEYSYSDTITFSKFEKDMLELGLFYFSKYMIKNNSKFGYSRAAMISLYEYTKYKPRCR